VPKIGVSRAATTVCARSTTALGAASTACSGLTAVADANVGGAIVAWWATWFSVTSSTPTDVAPARPTDCRVESMTVVSLAAGVNVSCCEPISAAGRSLSLRAGVASVCSVGADSASSAGVVSGSPAGSDAVVSSPADSSSSAGSSSASVT